MSTSIWGTWTVFWFKFAKSIQVLTNWVYDQQKPKAPRQKRGRKYKARDVPGDLPAETLSFLFKKDRKKGEQNNRVNKITSYLIYITVCYFPRMWWCCCWWWWWWWRHSRALLCLSFPTQKEAFHEFYVTSCLPFWWKERSHSSLCSSCMVKYHAESSEWKLHVFATYLIV